MKKILAVLLVICMVFCMVALCSCEEEESPSTESSTQSSSSSSEATSTEEESTEEASSEQTSTTEPETADLLSSAINKTEELDAFSAKTTINVKMKITGSYVTIEIPVVIDFSAKDVKTQSPKLSANYTANILGESQSADVYSDGTWVYVSSKDGSFKQRVEQTDGEYDYVGDAQDIVKEIPEEILDKATVSKDADGSRTIKVDITDEQFEALFGEVISGVGDLGTGDTDGQAGSGDGSGEGNTPEEAPYEISDTSIEIVIDKDGYIKSYEVSFKLDMTVEGTPTTSDVVAKIEYTERGSGVVVTPMEGYEDFEELVEEEVEEN